jgi:two-component system, LuxR family, response regulator FixJ
MSGGNMETCRHLFGFSCSIISARRYRDIHPIASEPAKTHRKARETHANSNRRTGAPVSKGEIFIVDDDPDVLDALCAAFSRAGYWATTFVGGRSFIQAARIRTPVCVLLDICMPGSSGLDILKELDARTYPAPILIVSGQGAIPSVVEAIKNGAFDFIEKRLPADAIVARVGEAVDAWADSRRSSNGESLAFPGYSLLTRREREVLSQIVAAASNKEAGRNLGISSRTVEIHRGHIMQKLSAKNSVDLIRIVLNKGLSR